MFANMIGEMRGAVPNYSALLARTHIQEAWRDIRNMTGWSFQLGNGGFGTPSVINAGSVTVTFGSASVVGDAAASAAWLAGSVPGSLITQRQFRVASGTIYNIIALDDTNPAAVVLTLDRFYFDTTSGSSLNYSIYQAYYATPVKDFLAWEAVIDINNSIDLVASGAKKFADYANQSDPQRQIFSNPGSLLAHGNDQRTGSATLGWKLFELYPQPLAQYAYSYWYTRAGADLVNPQDTLPYPITEHVVKTLARVKAYTWAEANRDPANPRGSGADFRFLIGSDSKMAAGMLKDLRNLDRDAVDMYYSVMTRVQGYGYPVTFNPATGMVSANNTL